MGRTLRDFQAIQETKPSDGMRNKIAPGSAGVPVATSGIPECPSFRGGFYLGPGDLALRSKPQMVDELDLVGGKSAQCGWLGTLFSAVGKVTEAGLDQWSGKMPLNRVGSLENLVEVKHGRCLLLMDNRP